MLPIERLYKIRELIQSKHNLKISDLSLELGVSEMTIHRDLQPLIEEGVVLKTYGGITLAHENNANTTDDVCVYCNQDINKRLAYRLILSNDEIEMTCCAHCGLLRQRQLDEKVIQSICQDFLRQTTISAPLAWYAMDTTIDMGCCQPQVLPFEYKDHATKFVRGFGGSVFSFNEAIEVVYKKMNCDGKSS